MAIALAALFVSGAAALAGCDRRDPGQSAEAPTGTPATGAPATTEVPAPTGTATAPPMDAPSTATPAFDRAVDYHVIVTSGEPEGIAAALSAARNGMTTLLVEEGGALGGLFTLGMLNSLDLSVSLDGTGTLLTQGIFREFYEALGNGFDIDEAKEWFLETCSAEPNLTVMLNTSIVAPVMDGSTITGLVLSERGSAETKAVSCLAVIDATVDADVAAAAGAPYTLGGEDYGSHGVMQGVTLVFEVSGVDWDALSDYLNRPGSTSGGAGERVGHGLSAIAREYKPEDVNMLFRGPNFARQRNGNVLLNALIIFGVDPLDPDSLAQGMERGAGEIPHIVRFMRESFPGFENAALYGHAPRLYVRETRHIVGEYRLTITDVLENADHWDGIGHGNYPVDIQARSPTSMGTVIGFPDIYSIPFRSLVPLEVEQLLVVGRSASYDSLPHGSARVVPIGMVTGEAAGAAAAYSVRHSVTFREMSRDAEAIGWLRGQLRSQGAYIVEYDPPRPAAMDHWAYPGLVVMRELGQVGGGYTNNYRLDAGALPAALQKRLAKVMTVVNERTAGRGEFQVHKWETRIPSGDVTVDLLLVTAARAASMGDFEWLSAQQPAPGTAPDARVFESADQARDYLYERGVLDERTRAHFSDLGATATNGHLYTVMGGLYLALMG